jgi:hypothetical protein
LRNFPVLLEIAIAAYKQSPNLGSKACGNVCDQRFTAPVDQALVTPTYSPPGATGQDQAGNVCYLCHTVVTDSIVFGPVVVLTGGRLCDNSVYHRSGYARR